MDKPKIRLGKDGLEKRVVKVKRSRKDRNRQHKDTHRRRINHIEATMQKERALVLRTIAIAAAILFLGFLGWAVFMLITADPDTQPGADQASSHQDPSNPTAEAPISEDPQAVATRFAFNPSVEKRLQWARNPQEIQSHLKSYPNDAISGRVLRLSQPSVQNRDGITCTNFEAFMADGNIRQLRVIPTRQGMKVDWDAYARHGSQSWTQILEQAELSADVRVRVKPVGLYLGNFNDESKWRCYLLSSPDLDQSIYGYVKLDSKTHKILKMATIPYKPEGSKVTLRIHKARNTSNTQQVEIQRILGVGWVLNQPETFEKNWIPPHYNLQKSKQPLHAPRHSF